MQPLFAINLPHGIEWLWIGLIVVLLFGADKLPKLARGLGRSLGEFKKAKDDFEKELHSSAAEAEEKKKLEDAPRVIAGPTDAPVPTTEPTKRI